MLSSLLQYYGNNLPHPRTRYVPRQYYQQTLPPLLSTLPAITSLHVYVGSDPVRAGALQRYAWPSCDKTASKSEL